LIIVNVMGDLVNARTAAERLGVDVRTLYAYVSRGALRRVPGPDGRSSRYDADELELLARRSRPRTLPRPAASIDLVIATRVSTVTDGMVRYRGTDVLDLIKAEEPFERVADLLWQAGPPGTDGGWTLPGAGERPAFPLPDEIPVLHRFAIAVAALPSTSSAGPAATSTPDWPSCGRRVIGCLVDASGSASPNRGHHDNADNTHHADGAPPVDHAHHADHADFADHTHVYDHADSADHTHVYDHAHHADHADFADHTHVYDHADHAHPVDHLDDDATVAARLWRRWSPLRPTATRIRALDIALVLLAEHELALSTLSVRVAASARAAPASCLLAGLSTLSGRLHGGAARAVHEKLAQGEPVVTGFGHPVHRHGDPRVTPLLEAVYAFATDEDRTIIENARREAPTPLNVDFALGALTYAARMPAEAATAIFAIARVAGWVAHAAEEYAEPPLRFRGRAVRPARTGLRSPSGG
jgi:citrate synthase